MGKFKKLKKRVKELERFLGELEYKVDKDFYYLVSNNEKDKEEYIDMSEDKCVNISDFITLKSSFLKDGTSCYIITDEIYGDSIILDQNEAIKLASIIASDRVKESSTDQSGEEKSSISEGLSAWADKEEEWCTHVESLTARSAELEDAPAVPVSLEAEGGQISREGMEEIVASALRVTLADRGTTAMTYGEADAVAGEIVAALTDAFNKPIDGPSLVSGGGDEDTLVGEVAQKIASVYKGGRLPVTSNQILYSLARGIVKHVAARPVSVSTGGEGQALAKLRAKVGEMFPWDGTNGKAILRVDVLRAIDALTPAPASVPEDAEPCALCGGEGVVYQGIDAEYVPCPDCPAPGVDAEGERVTLWRHRSATPGRWYQTLKLAPLSDANYEYAEFVRVPAPVSPVTEAEQKPCETCSGEYGGDAT